MYHSLNSKGVKSYWVIIHNLRGTLVRSKGGWPLSFHSSTIEWSNYDLKHELDSAIQFESEKDASCFTQALYNAGKAHPKHLKIGLVLAEREYSLTQWRKPILK